MKSLPIIMVLQGRKIEKRIKNNLIIRFLESLFSRLVITKKLLNLDKKYTNLCCDIQENDRIEDYRKMPANSVNTAF